MMEVLKDRHKVTYVAVPGAKNTKLQCNRIWYKELYVTLHFTLNYKILQCSALQYTARCTLHYTTLHYTTLLSTLHYTTLLDVQYTKLHCYMYTKIHYTTLYHYMYNTLNYTATCTLHYTTPLDSTAHHRGIHCNTSQYNAVWYQTVQCISVQ